MHILEFLKRHCNDIAEISIGFFISAAFVSMGVMLLACAVWVFRILVGV